MFVVVYLFRVDEANITDFLKVQKEAGEISQQYGALADETLAPFNLAAKYGCGSFLRAFEVGEDEQLYLGISRFYNREHHDMVMAKVDADARINILYEEMLKLIDMSHTVRGEFELET